MRYDESFQGLSITEASKLSNYQHFRSPLTEEKREYIGTNPSLFFKI
jgi:radial spoke head protein 9